MAEVPEGQDTKKDEFRLDLESAFAPGELAPADYSSEPNAELSPEAELALIGVVRNCAKRDIAARRMEVEQSWEARLFDRGYQHLLPRRGGGWSLPNEKMGYGMNAYAAFADLLETNIYGTHGDIISSALVRDIPECRFEPFDPNWDPDITAADKAKDYALIFSRTNDLKALHLQAARYMYTDGRVLFYTRYVLDGQRFGFEDPSADNPTVPEDETTGAPNSPNVTEGQEETQNLNDSPVAGRKPRGREITNVYGKLEHKVPIGVNSIHEMFFVQLSEELDLAIARAMFPGISNKIKPGSSGETEIELDRIARINSRLSIQASYITGDAQNKDVTIQRTWLRPSAFMDCTGTDLAKKELFDAFPDGALVVMAGSALAFARNESMDDHLHILQSVPGNGQNRAALGTKLIPVQKRLNTWLDLLNDYFVKQVPQTWMDADVFDLEAIRQQPNVPGGKHPFTRQPGVPTNELIFEENVPAQNPLLGEFIEFFFNEFPQMLSGALPSLFGAQSNTDTVGGIAIQRDQALGRLSSPWSALQAATACYFRQAVMCAAKCRDGAITESIPNRGIVKINADDLKGNVLCYPESDANIPETYIQKASRLQQLLVEGQNNPLLMRLLTVKKNQKAIKNAIGLTDLEFPEVDSVDKQLGEFELLLKQPAIPNPQIEQAQQQMEQARAQAEQAGEMDKFQELEGQLKDALSKLPPKISSVTVDPRVDDNETEAETCKEWLNGPEGRKFKKGSEAQQDSYENIRLHFLEHMDAAKQQAQENAPPPVTKTSLTAAVKDLPPAEAAALLQKAGIPAKAEDFMSSDAADAQKQLLLRRAIHKPEATQQ